VRVIVGEIEGKEGKGERGESGERGERGGEKEGKEERFLNQKESELIPEEEGGEREREMSEEEERREVEREREEREEEATGIKDTPGEMFSHQRSKGMLGLEVGLGLEV
jgi:hypothetical protein